MIFVDTSVWIDFFRGRNRKLADHLDELLDADSVALGVPVLVELVAGAPRAELGRLRRVLSALPVFYPSLDTWRHVETWATRGAGVGQRFGVGDLLIAAIAAERGGAVWSLDRDFARMARLKWVKVHTPA